MNIKKLYKKLYEKILQLPIIIQAILDLVVLGSVATVITIIMVGILIFFCRSRCLDSQYPRRYQMNGVCEEYRNGEWGEPSKDSIYYYNGAGSRVTE